MNNKRSMGQNISQTFFASHLVALDLFGLVIAFENIRADEVLPGVITLAAIFILPLVVMLNNLPQKVAQHISATWISILALVISLFGVLLMASDAIYYIRLPDDFISTQGMNMLRITAYFGLGVFALAFLVTLGAIVLEFRKRE